MELILLYLLNAKIIEFVFRLTYNISVNNFRNSYTIVWARASNLAAILTPSSSKLSFSLITSPELIPIRNSSFNVVSCLAFRALIAFWKSTAHCTADTALINSAKKQPSPPLKKRPLCFDNKSVNNFSHARRFLIVPPSSTSLCLL